MNEIRKRWTVLFALMAFVGLFGPLLGGAAAAQSPATDAAAWKVAAPEVSSTSIDGQHFGNAPQSLVVPDTSSVFHIGPYVCGGVPVSKDIFKNAGETEDHFDGRCANAFKAFTQVFPPDPKSGGGH